MPRIIIAGSLLPPRPLKVIARLLSLLVVLVAAGGCGLHWWAHRPIALAGGEAREVTIAPGSSVRGIGAQFEAAGVPLEPLLLAALARLENRATKLQAGTYAVTAELTPETILDKLQSGDVVRIALVVPEGWTFAQLRKAVAASRDLRQTTATLSDRDLMNAIGASIVEPEGQFFPDTYQFVRGTTDLEVLRRAYRMQLKRLTDAWAGRAAGLPLATPYEALILASIVEKETGRAEDRPQVAAVFINRLRQGMMLQTDPTVIYGMGVRFDGNLRRADLTTDTPYNTYVHAGLPPTPIALPGAAALAAVLNPPRSDALYFVARGDGSSVFSPNLVEHNRAVDQYQRRLAPPRGARAP